MLFCAVGYSTTKHIFDCSQDEKSQGKLKSWLDDLFDRALRWVEEADSFVVPTTKVGVVQQALSHLGFSAGQLRH